MRSWRLGTAPKTPARIVAAAAFSPNDLIHAIDGLPQGGPHCGVVLGFGGQLQQMARDRRSGRRSFFRAGRQRRYCKALKRNWGFHYRTPHFKVMGRVRLSLPENAPKTCRAHCVPGVARIALSCPEQGFECLTAQTPVRSRRSSSTTGWSPGGVPSAENGRTWSEVAARLEEADISLR